MTELKTLKDLQKLRMGKQITPFINENLLKQEAIKWVKNTDFSNFDWASSNEFEGMIGFIRTWWHCIKHWKT